MSSFLSPFALSLETVVSPVQQICIHLHEAPSILIDMGDMVGAVGDEHPRLWVLLGFITSPPEEEKQDNQKNVYVTYRGYPCFFI